MSNEDSTLVALTFRSKNKKWITAILLLLTLSAAAQDVRIQRGCRVGLPSPEGMALRRGASGGQTKQTGGDFYHGERHQLTVLVAFNDRSFKDSPDVAATMAQWNKIFNAENLSEAPFRGSVHDYFMAQSYGDFNLIFDLHYVVVPGNVKKYESDSADENSQYLVQDIMEVLKTRDIDWSLYDWNGDGFVNQLLIVYAGQGMNDYNEKEYKDKALIWPHQWWMSEHFKDRQPGVYCDPIPVAYGGKEYKVDCYCALAELTRNNDYGSFGTICHEYTHCFGFPDFYYGRSVSTVGKWDLMDSGNYNDNGYCPASYSAHERWKMQWVNPIELKHVTSITDLPALSDVSRAYLIRNDGHDDEYYIVENRQKKGWDEFLPGSGLVIFHIDYDSDIWVSTKVYPNSSSLKRYEIFHANNYDSAGGGWAYPYLANDSLTNHSEPAATLNNENTDGTKLMNKSVRDITVAGDLASFRFTIDQSTGIGELQAEGEPRELYRVGPVIILRYPNGVVRKVIRTKP